MKQLNKKGALDINNIIISVVGLIILIIITFLIVGTTSGDITTAADNISASGLPLASLFSSNGVVLLVFMAGLLLVLIGVSLGNI